MPSIAMTPYARDRAIRTIIGEAGNQGRMGRVAVAHTIANRAYRDGRTLDQVVDQNDGHTWQYTANDPRRGNAEGANADPNGALYQDVGAIVDGVAEGSIPDPTNGATHYTNPGLRDKANSRSKSWSSKMNRDEKSVTIGAHTFGVPPGERRPERAMPGMAADTIDRLNERQAQMAAPPSPEPAPGAWGVVGGAIDSIGNIGRSIGGIFSNPAPPPAAPNVPGTITPENIRPPSMDVAPPPSAPIQQAVESRPLPRVNPNQVPYSQEQGDALQAGLETRAATMRSALAEKMHAAIAASPPETQQALSVMRQPQAPASTMTPPGTPTLGEPSMMSAPGLAQYSGIPSVQNPDRWGFLDTVQKEPATPASLMHAAIQEAAPTSPIAASLAASIAPPPAQETYSGPKPLTQTGRQGISTRIAGMPTMPPAAGMPAAPPSPLLAAETVGAPQSFRQATPFQPNDNRFTPAAPQGPMPSPQQFASMGGTVASSLLGPAGAAAAGLAPNIGGLFARPAGVPAPAPRDETPAVRQQQVSTFADSPEMKQDYQTDSHPGRTLRDSQSGLGTVGSMAWGGAKGAVEGGLFGGPGGALLGGAYGAMTGPSGMAVNNLFGGPQPGQSYGGANNFAQGTSPTFQNHVRSAGYGPLSNGWSYGYSPFGGVATVHSSAPTGIQIAASGPGPFGGWGGGGTGGSPTHGTGGLY